MFKRRENRSIFSSARHMLWPKTGWARAWQYAAKRVIRIKATPHAIAIGCAMGVFASFTPFVGLHSAIAIGLAWILGGSLIAAFIGTFVGNPFTFPLIWATTLRLGNWILDAPSRHPPDLTEGIFQRSFDVIWPLIKPMAVGGLPIGLLAALAAYIPVRYIVSTYQERRAIKRAKLERQNNTQGGPA